jgi:putative oxidoreductase
MARPHTESGTSRVFPGGAASHGHRKTVLQAFFEGDRPGQGLERYGALAARILLSQIFLMAGAGKLMDWSGTEAHMADMGMFWIPVFLVGAIVIEIGGGLSLLLGYKARLGALILFLFLIPTTLVFHSFWTFPEEQQQTQIVNFMKNLAIMGGLLLVVTYGAGFCSVDKLTQETAAERIALDK